MSISLRNLSSNALRQRQQNTPPAPAIPEKKGDIQISKEGKTAIGGNPWGELESYLTTPSFTRNEGQKKAVASISTFFVFNKDFMGENGLDRKTLQDLVNGTGKFGDPNLPVTTQYKISRLREDAQLILTTPGLFDELDKVGKDGKLHQELQDGRLDPNSLKDLLSPPVYM